MNIIREIVVSISDLKVSTKPNKLITYALGSCIGIAIYDIKNHIGGLSHVLLPSSRIFGEIDNEYKFADLAIPILRKKIIELGGEQEFLRAKIAGGANMFYKAQKISFYDIGRSNSTIAKKKLKELNIPLVAEDIGGIQSRTMSLDLSTLEVEIKKYQNQLSEVTIL